MRDSIFGALVTGPDGNAVLAPPPIDPTVIGQSSALARADGGWDVVFAELQPGPRVPHEPPLVRLWSSEFDGRAWHELEAIPLPPDYTLTMAAMAPLVRHGDTLAFAVPATSMTKGDDVIIFQRTRGQWKAEAGGTRGAAYVRMAFIPRAGWRLAAVHADYSLRSDENSLFLYVAPDSRHTGWRSEQRLVRGGPEPVHDISFDPTATGWSIAWLAHSGNQGIARVMLANARTRDPLIQRVRAPGDNDRALPAASVTLDSDAVFVRQAVLPRDRIVWVTDHVSRLDSGDRRELRVFMLSRGSAVQIGRLANPFASAFRIAVVDTNAFMMVGPGVQRFATGDSAPVTVVVRVAINCTSHPGGGTK
jgi:hypothetical protein